MSILQQEILVDALGKASKLSALNRGVTSDRKKSPHKVVDPFSDHDNSEIIDEDFNNQEYEKLTKQLNSAVVFMDSVSAECFSWNQFGDQSLTSNHLLKLGVLTILDLTSDQDWPSIDRLKDLKEMNSSWNNYISNNDNTQNSENVVNNKELNDSEEEDDEFEKFYSDDEDEAPTVNTKKSTSSEGSEKVEHFIVNSDMIPSQHDTSNVQKAVFFVCHLTKTLEQAVRKSVEKYKFTHLYFYCPFSEGFCEYYQSKVLEGVELDENYVPSVGYFKDYLTYSDLIEKCKLIIFETQYNLYKKENSSKKFENEINNSIHVEVNQYSFNVSAILPNIFVTPTCHSVFPILSLSQKPLASNVNKPASLLSGFNIGSPQKEKKSEVLMTFDELPTPFQLQFKMLAATLRDLLKNMRMSVDVYSLGQSSNLIAQDLQNLIREESFRTTNSCTLVLVDRSLDLVSPMVHSESILDKVLNTTERKTGLSTNVRFNGMSLNSSLSDLRKLSMSGLLHHGNEKIINLLNSIIEKKNSESIGEMKVILDKLQNLTTKKGELSLEKTIQSLKNLMKDLTLSALSENCDVIQFISTVIHSLEIAQNNTKRAELASVEKLILYECDNNQDELLSYIINILKKDHSKFSLQEILRLVVMIYSVVTPDCSFKMERDLKKLLSKHILENYKHSSCASFIESMLSDETLDQLQNPTEEASPSDEEEEEDWDNWNDDFDDEKPKKKVDAQENIAALVEEDLATVFKCLNAIKRQRQHFQTLDKLAANDHVFIFENESGNLGNTETPYRSFCKQLAYVLGETEPCPDLIHNASLLSAISNTFGFMFQSKSKPIKNESSTMILFIVGGITFGEITDIKQMINSNLREKGQHSPYFGKKIILGSTCITSSEIILEHLFSH